MQLTRNWRLENGGLLMFLDENDWGTVRSVSTPTFNTFTFFDVSQETRTLPHTVTAVAPGLPDDRYAITGWMQYRGHSQPFGFMDRYSWGGMGCRSA